VNEAYEPKAEEYAFNYLFPYGIHSLKEKRKVPITPRDYFQIRILEGTEDFHTKEYLFYALSMYEFNRVKSNINVCGKKIKQAQGEMVEDIHLYIKILRGSRFYWKTVLNELLVMIRCFGQPSLLQ